MKIAAEQGSPTACSSATETRTTSPQLKNIRPNYFVSLPIKNENIKGAIKIFEEFYKKNDPRNASGLTGYQKVRILPVVLSFQGSSNYFPVFQNNLVLRHT